MFSFLGELYDNLDCFLTYILNVLYLKRYDLLVWCWQCPSNMNGGKWKLRLRKGVMDRCWENLLLAVVGEMFDVGDEICGIVVCVRNQVVLSLC